MRLLESLRNSRSISSVREHVERARDEWNDVERRIRQRMRIYPEKLRAKLSVRFQAELQPGNQDRALAAKAAAGDRSDQPAKPIISIRGRDLPPEDIDDPAA